MRTAHTLLTIAAVIALVWYPPWVLVKPVDVGREGYSLASGAWEHEQHYKADAEVARLGHYPITHFDPKRSYWVPEIDPTSKYNEPRKAYCAAQIDYRLLLGECGAVLAVAFVVRWLLKVSTRQEPGLLG